MTVVALQRRLDRIGGTKAAREQRELAALSDGELMDQIATHMPDPAGFLAMPRAQQFAACREFEKQVNP